VTAAIDVGLHLVTRVLGEEAARRIAAQMEIAPHA
jgi:transcriptional regulator GlxA family with amidase domain